MIKKSIEDIKLPQLSSEEFRGKTFTIVWIQGIHTRPLDNHYKVLFREVINSRSGDRKASCLIEKIFPEFLQHYKIGCHYRDSKYLKKIAPLGQEIAVSVESTASNRMVEVSEILTDNEYRLNQRISDGDTDIDFGPENKRQYCLLFENADQIVVIPCSVIGAAYYFSSSSMRKQIFAQNLEGLYESIERSDSDRVRILLKTVAKEKDAPHIVRFATNMFANSRWKAIKNDLYTAFTKLSLSGSKSDYVPLKIDLPVKQPLKMKIRGFKFRDLKRRKDKILVFDILDEDSDLDFKSLVIVSKGRKKIISPESPVVHVRTLETTNRLTGERSSPGLSKVSIRLKGRDLNDNFNKLIISKEYLSDEEHGDIFSPAYTSGKVNMSIMSPDSPTDEKVRRGSLERTVSKKDEAKEEFTLANFCKLLNFLRESEDISNLEISGKGQMPLRYENPSVCSLRESYDRTLQNRRQFMHATFDYDGCNVCLIEVDHVGLPKAPATYALLTMEQDKLARTAVEFVLALYVRYAKLESIIEELRKEGIILVSKKHPGKIDEKHFRNWGKDLLTRVDIAKGQ